MSPEQDQELQKLKEALLALSARVAELERTLALQNSQREAEDTVAESNSFHMEQPIEIREPASVIETAKAPAEVPAAEPQYKEERAEEERTEEERASQEQVNPAIADALITEPSKDLSPPCKKPNQASLETKIGLYWLNRLGIGFLVVGVALLILYSFQYFGAWAKLATGFLIAGLLVGLGELIDRKQKMPLYGNALAGGGWSLAFFSAYCMHHVKDVQVIADPLLGSLIMLSVAILAVLHAWKKNSEPIASLAIALGFITLGLTEAGPFSAGASAILTAALAFLVHKCKWTGLYGLGIATAFFFFFASSNDTLKSGTLLLRLSYIAPYWLAASFLPLSLPAEQKAKASIVAVAILSSVCTFLSVQPALAASSAKPDAILFGIGSVTYALLALVMKSKHRLTASLVDGLIALASFALLIPALNNGPLQLFGWSVQLALILWAGLKYNLRSFRWFSYPLAFVLFCAAFAEMTNKQTLSIANITLPWSAINILAPTSVLAVSAMAYLSDEFKETLSANLRSISFYWYFHLAALLAFFLVPLLIYGGESSLKAVGPGMLAFLWSLESLALGLVSLKYRRPYLLVLSIMGFLIAACSSLFIEAVPQQIIPAAASLAMAFTLASRCRKAPEPMRPKLIFGITFTLACLWLFLFQAIRISEANYLAYALMAESLILVEAGRRLNEVLLRTMGVFAATLLVFGLLFDSRLAWFSALPAAAAIYACAYIYRSLQFKDGLDNTRVIVRNYLNIAATIALTTFLGWRFSSYFVSCSWALEGLALLSSGFMLQDKLLRISGLSVFALVVLRLLIIDLSGAATIYRIVAFIVAGLVLMIAAYAYSSFSKRLQQSERQGSSESEST